VKLFSQGRLTELVIADLTSHFWSIKPRTTAPRSSSRSNNRTWGHQSAATRWRGHRV